METSGKARWKRFRGVYYPLAFLFLSAGVVLLQLRLRGFKGPLSDYLLISVLIIANFLLLAAVIFMTARSLWKLSEERRLGVLGARFRTRLVTAFVSLSIIPTILLFLIASGLFTRSIERLFSLKIQNLLNDSVSVTQAYYDRLKAQALFFGRLISVRMSEERLLLRFESQALKEYLGGKAREYGLGAVELFRTPGERTVLAITEQFPKKTFSATETDFAARAFESEEQAEVIDMGKRGEIVRAVVAVHDAENKGRVAAVISVSYYVPRSLAARTEEIRTGYAEYRSTFNGKEPIKLAYRLGFLAVTLTLLLAAIWVALRVAADITVPIKKLAEGTKAVAAGNLDFKIEERSGDEVGVLIGSFNRMTADLKDSREEIERKRQYTETVLSNIDTGVISIDHAGKVTTVNPAASRILGIQAQDVLGRRYHEAFGFIELDPVRALFRKLDEGQGRAEDVIPLAVRGEILTLRMRISSLKDSSGSLPRTVITFNDLTKLLRAQKAETWQGVARRIAHEFKNPLTPIKLSAERLRRKYTEGTADFNAIFDECSKTIVQEADGLRKLVDEFAHFARMPVSNPRPQALAPVLESAIVLYHGAHRDIEFVKEIAGDMPAVIIDSEQIKRVFINLFENAVEAMDRKGRIWVSVRTSPSGTARIEVADEGTGIAQEDTPRLFEPNFSRKKREGGLGLAIVDRIIAEHNGSIRAEANQPKGARFIIELPVGQG